MNDETGETNTFDGAASAEPPPRQRPLDEHLKDIKADSPGVEVIAAAKSALADSWPRAEIKAKLEELGVGPVRIKKALPTPPKPRLASATATAARDGLFFFKADGSVWKRTTDPESGETIEIPICNSLRVLQRTTDSEGGDASFVTATINIHGETRQTRLSAAVALTDVRAAISELIANGLKPAHRGEKAYAEILDMILSTDVPRARYLTETGHCEFSGAKAFALPSGVIGAQPDAEVIWDGDMNLCRPDKARTLEQWLSDVAAPCNGNAIPMTAIGAMLASAAIPFLPPIAERNTMIHFVEVTTTGKTTTIRIAASVWGKGSDTSDPKSYVDTWRTTGNASENLLAGHNHMGLCLDELKLVDAKDAWTWAYAFASGQSKHRMNRDTGARRRRSWELFPLSSGNVTLEDRASDASPMKRRVMEGAAEVRVINIAARNVFPNLNGRADAKALVEQLAASAATVYGHAGPAYVERLLKDGDNAREWIAYYWGVWAEVVNQVLPPGAAGQAKRVASRLGSIACGAAHAAQALELPWTLPNDQIGQAVDVAIGSPDVAQPPRAVLWAFAKILEVWLTEHGGTVSTENAALGRQLCNLFASYNQRFHHIGKGAGSSQLVPPDGTPTPHDGMHLAWPRWGWQVKGEGAGRSINDDLTGDEQLLLYVDVLPAAFDDALHWSATQRGQFINGLKERGLLIPAASEPLQNFRWVGSEGKPYRIYRIKAEFFEEEKRENNSPLRPPAKPS